MAFLDRQVPHRPRRLSPWARGRADGDDGENGFQVQDGAAFLLLFLIYYKFLDRSKVLDCSKFQEKLDWIVPETYIRIFKFKFKGAIYIENFELKRLFLPLK